METKDFVLGYGAGKNSAVSEKIVEEVDAWLDEHITNPDSPPLDRSLTSSSAAAPADLVGDISDTVSDIKNTLSNVEEILEVPAFWAGNGTGYESPNWVKILEGINLSNGKKYKLKIWTESSPSNNINYIFGTLEDGVPASTDIKTGVLTSGAYSITYSFNSTSDFTNANVLIYGNVNTIVYATVEEDSSNAIDRIDQTLSETTDEVSANKEQFDELLEIKTVKATKNIKSTNWVPIVDDIDLYAGNAYTYKFSIPTAIDTNISCNISANNVSVADLTLIAGNTEVSTSKTQNTDLTDVVMQCYFGDTHGDVYVTAEVSGPDVFPNAIDRLEKTKQDKLISGTNIKTIDGQSVLGSGNIISNSSRIIVTQIEKQIIETQVETVTSGRNAGEFGVLPSNDGATNKANLQLLLNNGGTIIIDIPGLYEFDNDMRIGSNTKLIFGSQVIISRTNTAGALFINSGAFSKEYNDNIIIDGLNVKTNNYHQGPENQIKGLNGIISFYYVTNLVLHNMRCDDLPSTHYFIHLCRWENVIIDTIYVAGLKDAIHVNTGRHIKISNGYFRTYDDPIALNACDYPEIGCPELGWIDDAIINNCVDLSDTSTTGYFARLLAGAWLDWESGNQYRNSDIIVADGKIYRCANARTNPIEYYTSTVKPTHTSGEVTEADGITWRYIQTENLYNAGCRNVLFENIYLEKERTAVIGMIFDNDAFNRGYYPNAIAFPQENILFRNIVTNATINTFISANTPVDRISIDDSLLQFEYILILWGTYLKNNINSETYISMRNNVLKEQSGETTITSILVDNDRTAKLYASSNYNYDDATIIKSSGVTIVTSDPLR